MGKKCAYLVSGVWWVKETDFFLYIFLAGVIGEKREDNRQTTFVKKIAKKSPPTNFGSRDNETIYLKDNNPREIHT